MTKYLVEFVVQVEKTGEEWVELREALRQAEMYLNTGDRCVDCNVSLLTDERELALASAGRLPHAAEFLNGCRASHHCDHDAEKHEEMGWTCNFWPVGGPCCGGKSK